MSRSVLPGLLAAGLLLGPVSRGIQAAPPPEPRITRQFEGTSLRDAVAALFAQRGEPALVLPEVANHPVDLSLKDVPWRAALQRVLAAGHATYRREDGVTVVERVRNAPSPTALAEVTRDGSLLRIRLEHYPLQRLPALLGRYLEGKALGPVPAGLAERTVTAVAGPAPVQEVLRQIAAVAEVAVPAEGPLTLAPLAPGLRVEPLPDGRLEVDLRQVPLQDAYAALLPEGTALMIRPEVPPVPVSMKLRAGRDTILKLITLYARSSVPHLETRAESSTFHVTLGTAPEGRKVTVEFLQLPLRQALQLLLKGSGLDYAVDPTVPDVPITAQLKDVEVAQALRLLVRLAAAAHPGITLRRSGEMWMVAMRNPGG
jgi:hypothetical protein